MIFDGSMHQLPDTDPGETAEWLDSLDAVVDVQGKTRARYLLSRLLERARESQVSFPATVSTPYVNSIPREQEPWFPGDEHIERRIRAYIRWNAAVMVVRANTNAEGIGGHLSTFASSASLYEVGFNHFFRGKDSGTPGDHIYFQGHAAPGVYARAFIERRLDEDDLDHFRREIGRNGEGLSSYPHPRLMPEFWEFPTVSMGLGPLTALYHARFNRYLQNRQLDDTSNSRVWAFLGDGECDEPETLGSISLAAREQLDNLTFVVNCNLQRLDGPVRGNGKIIQELEAVFRGAGWNVIKVVWGSKWDELLAQDVDGVLLDKMNSTVDGEFQRYSVEGGAYIREHFFGPDPRLHQMVAHLSDEELVNLPRGGHDYRKLYAAYKAAADNLGSGKPTVILAKTIKGWTLGSQVEGRNATHQIKKLNTDQLRAIYKAPSERAVLKELAHIDTHLKRFISLSPFLVISSGDQRHQMDCSPRGGDAGFVKVLDQQTLLIPDSIGNNRLDTLTNIIATSQVGLLFFIPGIDEVVRVNGSATLQTGSDLLKHFDTLKNNPKLVIKVIVEAAYMHCPKAMMRSKLWSIEHHQNIDAMPTIGQIISDQTKSTGPVESREEMLKRYTPDL